MFIEIRLEEKLITLSPSTGLDCANCIKAQFVTKPVKFLLMVISNRVNTAYGDLLTQQAVNIGDKHLLQ
ncbi:unnamed protein product [Hymenolepis diminuta]|uniref:Uncharacterized protein n=1 Tax=Hymenolepis diminuta TaxID=6216 RepID=A0A564XVP9_HYMDI|nr:unnamed protein product [Hymenolepis diminuta]